MYYLASSADLKVLIPDDFLIQALDDNSDGAEDTGLFAAVVDEAEREIHGYCRQRYATPFAAPVPDLIVDAVKILTGLRLYLRRGRAGDDNPFTAEAARIRKKLQAIAEGNENLTADMLQQQNPVGEISETSRIHSSAGHVMA